MKIGVLTGKEQSYSVQRILEAGRNRGHEIWAIDPGKCFVSLEEGMPHLRYSVFQKQEGLTDDNLLSLDAVIPRIGTEITFYGTAIVRQFEMRGVFVTSPSQAILRCRNKLRALQVLSKAGVGLPKTAFACNPEDIDQVLEAVGGPPVVIKLMEGSQGMGVMLAESRRAAKSIIEAFYGVKINILVQEFIEEAGSRDFRVFIVDNKVVASMERVGQEGDFRSNIHRGGMGNKVKLTKEAKETAKKAAKALGLAIAGVDLIPSKRGPLVMEVNSSPGLEGIEKASGVDVATKIIEYVEKNLPKKDRKKDKIGV